MFTWGNVAEVKFLKVHLTEGWGDGEGRWKNTNQKEIILLFSYYFILSLKELCTLLHDMWYLGHQGSSINLLITQYLSKNIYALSVSFFSLFVFVFPHPTPRERKRENELEVTKKKTKKLWICFNFFSCSHRKSDLQLKGRMCSGPLLLLLW